MRLRDALFLVLGSTALAAFSACGSSDTADGAGGAGGQGTCPPIIPFAKGKVPLMPDSVSTCSTSVCNYQTQEGCSATLSCRPSFPAGSTTVAPVCEAFGSGTTAASCETSADCARGYLCATVIPASTDGTKPAVSRCYKQCCAGDAPGCDSATACIRQFYVKFPAGNLEHPVDLCVPTGTCDVFDANSCATDLDPPTPRECKIVDFSGAVACMPKSTRKLNEVCSEATNGCAQGFTCVLDDNSNEMGHCRRLCRAVACGEPSCPKAEGNCVHYDRDPPGVGECAMVSAP